MSRTIETDFQSNHDSSAVTQRHISVIAEGFGRKLERILSELEKVTESVKHQSKKHPSDQRVFIEVLHQRVAVKSLFLRSITHPLFREMIQPAKPDLFLPVYNTLRLVSGAWRMYPDNYWNIKRKPISF
jgi:hypothetical protein